MKLQKKREDMGKYQSKAARIDGSSPGWSLDRCYYKDPVIYAKELDKIIFNSWVFAGHVSQVPKPGDFFLFTLADESIIIVRTAADEVAAYYNVCRHRGSQLCKESKGNLKRFTCPYHAWTYGLDGALKSARGMPEGVDLSNSNLHPCALEFVDGLIFVNLANTPDDLAPAKRDMAAPMAMYDFPNMKVAAHKHYPIEANWKVTLENYQECYHCAPSHPEYALSHTLKVEPERFDKLQQHMAERMESCGVRHFEVDKQFDMQQPGAEQYAYSRYALFEKYQTGSKDGEAVAPLLGSLSGFDHGASDMNIGPLTYFLAYNDHVVVYVFKPTGPDTSSCDIYWLVRSDAEEGEDYELERLTWLWDVTTHADERIIVDNQKGINSRKYQPGPLSSMEYMVDRMITWYLGKLNA
jgi:phenylpropionate dioxygenase-like ring-hydroxylating dioxygenase large terminal subunit